MNNGIFLGYIKSVRIALSRKRNKCLKSRSLPMKTIMKNNIILLLLIPMLSSFVMHKYYLSVTDLTYNQDEQAVQMITRIFYDDLEEVLNERYDAGIIVDATADQKRLDSYLEKYLTSKIQLTINNVDYTPTFIGKEYEDDFIVCYSEVSGIENIRSFEITNKILMDLFPEQKNMIHTNVNNRKKSFLLTLGNANGVLNFSE